MGSKTMCSFGSVHPQMMALGRGTTPKAFELDSMQSADPRLPPRATQPEGCRVSGWMAMGGIEGHGQSKPKPQALFYE